MSKLGLDGQCQHWRVKVRVRMRKLHMLEHFCSGSRLGLGSQGYGWRAKVRDAVPRFGLESQD